MIRVPGFRGAAFTTAVDGDAKSDKDRVSISQMLDISSEWAMVHQVHGFEVVETSEPGWLGDADALFTRQSDLPVAVFAADCAPIVVESSTSVGAAHAGWRGLVSGVVEALVERMASTGDAPLRAAIGPTIGACCFEVGPEVSEQFPIESRRTTTWGTPSVDLVADARRRLAGLDVWSAPTCTRCGAEMHSYRSDGTAARMVGLGWLP